jgi:hypothetical protein
MSSRFVVNADSKIDELSFFDNVMSGHRPSILPGQALALGGT